MQEKTEIEIQGLKEILKTFEKIESFEDKMDIASYISIRLF